MSKKVLWWIDNQTRKIAIRSIGYFCIFIFFTLTSYVIFIFYSKIIISFIERHAYRKLLFHLIFGNWLVMNIYFNFIKAWLTSPGLSKDYQDLSKQFPICKKCLYHKPPRTHHCSWCNLCILRYDHHCPWLNNCVGFYNHRYFFQFCCFMALGCLYAGIFGLREYQRTKFEIQVFRFTDSFFAAGEILDAMGVDGFITHYLFVISLGMGCILVGLSCWHGRMIGRGETSVERLIDKNYIHDYYQQGFIFVKTTDMTTMDNWKQFFGVRNLQQFIRRVLLPSTHKPRGNGITTDDYDNNTHPMLQKKNSDQFTPPRLHSYHSVPGGYIVSKDRTRNLMLHEKPIFQSFHSCYQPQTSVNDWQRNNFVNEI